MIFAVIIGCRKDKLHASDIIIVSFIITKCDAHYFNKRMVWSNSQSKNRVHVKLVTSHGEKLVKWY